MTRGTESGLPVTVPSGTGPSVTVPSDTVPSDTVRSVTVRDATPADLPTVAAAYAGYVLTSPATFDLVPPTLEAWQTRLAALLPVDRFLVAVSGEEVVGFAYSGAYRPKAAYATTRETSVYTLPGHSGRGVGGALYAVLIPHLDVQGALLAVANIAEPNPASAALHASFGFTPVGTLHGVGVKFGEPRDVTLWQRPCAPPA